MQNFITRPPVRLLKLGCICLLALVLAACSLARFGYSYGDTVTYWWLNGYVGFDASQKPWAKQRIGALFAWHRRTQLKHYVALLTGAQRRLQHEVTKQQMLDDYDELIKSGDSIVDEIAPDLADLALSMEAGNLEHLRHKFETNNEKYRKDHLRGDLQDKQKSRYKDVMEWAEYWFGNFSDEQEAVIRRASDQRPLSNEMWAADRVLRQQSLIALVQRIQQERLPHAVAAETIKSYIRDNYMLHAGAAPEMKAFYEASKDGAAQLVVTIVNITTPKQKAHAIARLQHWIDDFNALADKA